jgi:hypothetical protein
MNRFGLGAIMRQSVLLASVILTFSVICFGQLPATRAEPVPDAKPIIMGMEALENIEVPGSMDRFGKTNDKEKWAKLDIFSSFLSSKNSTVEFVIQLRAETKQVLGKNMEFVYLYLTEKRKISPNRVSFAVSDFGEEETQLWLIPLKNFWFPDCKDCPIIPAEDEEKLKEYFQVKKSKKSK